MCALARGSWEIRRVGLKAAGRDRDARRASLTSVSTTARVGGHLLEGREMDTCLSTSPCACTKASYGNDKEWKMELQLEAPSVRGEHCSRSMKVSDTGSTHGCRETCGLHRSIAVWGRKLASGASINAKKELVVSSGAFLYDAVMRTNDKSRLILCPAQSCGRGPVDR